MKMRRIIYTALALCLCLNAAAQTRSETKLYTKTIGKATVKDYNKFLSKYPDSVYSPEIQNLLDTEIRRQNTSELTRAEAVAVVGGEAVGWKMDNVDYVVGVKVAEGGDILVSTYGLDGSKAAEDRVVGKYELGTSVSRELVDSLEVVEFNKRNMLSFSYVNQAEDGEMEYVAVLYDYRNGNAYNAMFYGENILPAGSAGEYMIEGQCLETLSGGVITAELMWAINRIADNPALKVISKADLLTNESVEWWLSRNTKAETSNALRLNFGILDPESSLVAEYGKARKEKGDRYDAAYFDLRGYTVIVAYSKASKEYLLVWAEPVCNDKNTDRLLKNIYFEGNGTSSLAMLYYQGKRSFKYRINLSDKSLRK